MANGFAVFSGGGVHFEAAITLGLCTGVQMISNAAASFGGAFTSFAGSTCYFTESEFSDNVSGFYGGGMLALYGNATVSYSKINRNRQAALCHSSKPGCSWSGLCNPNSARHQGSG